ncbi:MAG: hypothetical protein ACLPID_11310 [Beijerinckiaceae bacterium]
MRKKSTFAFALCLLCIGSVLLSLAPSAAQSDSKENLVQDITAYKERCVPVKSNLPNAFQSCANEKAGLVDRQHRLNLTDADLGKGLDSRQMPGQEEHMHYVPIPDPLR